MERRNNHMPSLEDMANMNLPPMPEGVDWSNPQAMLQAMGMGAPGGIPMPVMSSASEVRKQAKARTASIFDNYDLLQSTLERHEATIQKRWMKKTIDQRRKILLNAWGGKMSATHRPDFAALRKKSGRVSAQQREAYIWPSINEEDLTKPRTLLLLLNSRGRNHPCEFAAADGEAMHLGHVATAVMPIFLNEHVMMFSGRKTRETYAQLINWADHPDAFEWMHTRKGAQPGEGLLILECQERLMKFLVKCAQEILHDLTGDLLLNAPTQTAPPSVSENATGLASLAVMAAETPYRVPAQLSFARIETLLAAKKDSSADHMWSLREDPAYFTDHMQDALDHRQECIKDAKGQMHPLFRFGREELVWGRVLSSEVLHAYHNLEIWTELLRQARVLKTMQERYAKEISPEKDLPEDYLNAILAFQFLLNQAAKGSLGLLKIGFVASPPWRPHFVRNTEENPESTGIYVSSKPNPALDKVQEQLLWLAKILWEDGKDLFLARMPAVVDELQRIIDSDKKAQDMISRYIASVFADLAIVCECLRQVDTYQPWSNTFEDAMVERKEGIEKEFTRRLATLHQAFEALDSKKSGPSLAKLGTPTDMRFRYPVNKRQTRDNVEAMQLAEHNLDAFWRHADEITRPRAGSVKDLEVGALLQERVLLRTPDWVEPSASKVTVSIQPLLKPLSEIYFDLERRTERTVERASSTKSTTSKQKTRGEPGAQAVSGADNIEAEVQTSPARIFKVDNRALKVFRTLFYTPSASATPGEIPWLDFVHALVSVGFQAEKLYGSIWQFSPTDLDVERSIQFHDPHPSGKIPYRVARRHGRRLNRAYGWEGGMFEGQS